MTQITNGEPGLSVRDKLNQTGLAKNNFAASADPTNVDDALDGYIIGSTWINGNRKFVMTRDSAGVAEWMRVLGDSDFTSLTVLINNVDSDLQSLGGADSDVAVLALRVDDNDSDILVLQNRVSDVESDLAAFNVAAIDSDITVLQNRVSDVESDLATFNVAAIDSDLAVINARLDSADSDIVFLRSSYIPSIPALVGAGALKIGNGVIIDSNAYIALGSYDSDTLYFIP